MKRLQTYQDFLRKRRLLRLKRRRLTLIEVLIAFFIVVMSIFPLLYPHVFIYRQQSEFIQKIEMNHVVNLLFGEVYRRLYQQEIPLNDLLTERQFTIDENLLRAAGYEGKPGFKGTYTFNIQKSKISEDKSKAAYLLKLTFLIDPTQQSDDTVKTYHFDYLVFVSQQAAAEDTQEESSED